MTRDWETLLPLLVHIQAHLEGDLGLEALSRKAGLSPFYLQRLFKAAIGETPKAYTARLRLERGAFRLLVHDSSVLDIALECGFQSHETFLRAFRRRFGRLPGDYREWVRGQLTAWDEPSPEDCAEADARDSSESKKASKEALPTSDGGRAALAGSTGGVSNRRARLSLGAVVTQHLCCQHLALIGQQSWSGCRLLFVCSLDD